MKARRGSWPCSSLPVQLSLAAGVVLSAAQWGCSSGSIVQDGQGGTAGKTSAGGAGGSVVVTLTTPLPNADAAADARSCRADGDKCYVVVDAGPYCGDGIMQTERGEECDDANRIGGDGCSGTCKLEPNHICPTPGQPCISTVVCGDGVREPGESCDDHNTSDGDGCSSHCAVEPGWLCPTAGQPCTRLVTCGDGRLQSGEQCDLGSANGTGVGCDSHCVLQPGWTCKGHTCQLVPVCGDGQVTGGEQCDEGKTASGTKCCESCRIAASSCSCPSSGGACQDNSRCGNGVLEKDELCDDGNTKDGDGCTGKCQIESGWQCRMAGKPCNPLCGDSRIIGSEECDDGNPDTGDGCSSICRVEPGWDCGKTIPSRCTHSICGNGKVETGETCDDGNTVPFDGCSSTCQKDPVCGTTTSAVGECKTVCGDGLYLPGVEECDDGNVLDGDGCSHDCKIEPGNTCRSIQKNPPAKLDIPIVARDFKGVENGEGAHPDFGTYCCDDSMTKGRGIVAATLALDRKPVWAGPAQDPVADPKSLFFTGKKEFDQWYRDVAGVNMTYYETLTLLQNATATTTYAMNSATDPPWYDMCGYFPLDDLTKPLVDQNTGTPITYHSNQGQPDDRICHAYQGLGFGNSWANHNFSFTTEARYWFQYQGGENLKFTGDDDVWVFINGTLVIEMPGVHQPRAGIVVLDASNGTAQVTYPDNTSLNTTVDLKMTIGKLYEAVVFQAERWCCGSNYMLTLANFVAGRSQCGPTCGDGTIAGTEECDNGADNADGTYGGCTTECKFGPFCGDGSTNGAEECDDGRNITVGYNVSGCGPGCTLPPRCGDSVVQLGEECDEGDQNQDSQCGGGCSSTCQLNPGCGDAHLDAACGEACDDGLNSGGYGFCAPACVWGPHCGDGVLQSDQGEECDSGAKNSDAAGSTCTTTCMKPGFCGDGIVQAERGETCDDAKNDGTCGGCTPDCQRGPYCGDGVLQKECGEVCDYGTENTSPANAAYGGCLTNCQLGPYCGDGVLQSPDEQCDRGPANGRPDSDCSASCIQQILVY
jgi:fibro-slime domain-containing protein